MAGNTAAQFIGAVATFGVGAAGIATSTQTIDGSVIGQFTTNGNLITTGYLNVQGSGLSTFVGSISCAGISVIGTANIPTIASTTLTANAATTNTLTVTTSATFNGTIGVVGVSTLTTVNATTINVGTLAVTGTSSHTGNATFNGNLTGTGGATLSGFGKVYNAVWNDIADLIDLQHNELVGVLSFGYVYVRDLKTGNIRISNRYASSGIIGIASDTYGIGLGQKDTVDQLPIAIGGFVLARTPVYPAGTPLTSDRFGMLTKAHWFTRMLHPERIVATFFKREDQLAWNGISVDNRHWVKVQ